MKKIITMIAAVALSAAALVAVSVTSDVASDDAPVAEATAGGCEWRTGYKYDYIPPFDPHGTFGARCTTGDSNDRWYAIFTCRYNASTSVDATTGAYAVGTTWRNGRCPTNWTAHGPAYFVKYDA